MRAHALYLFFGDLGCVLLAGLVFWAFGDIVIIMVYLVLLLGDWLLAYLICLA